MFWVLLLLASFLALAAVHLGGVAATGLANSTSARGRRLARWIFWFACAVAMAGITLAANADLISPR
jgi:hypothetical protein